MRLSHKDFAALQRAILQLHGFRDLASVRREMPGIFLKLVATINLMRRGRDFDERDRLMLNLLRPHYDQAHRNIKLMESLLAQRTQALSSYHLSRRETEIADLLAEGKSNPEIAIILPASVRTVEKHMERILQKIGVENRTAAAIIVAQCRQPAKLTAQPSVQQQ